MGTGRDAATVPTAAKWLGGLGLLPFIGLALAQPFLAGDLRARFAFALAAYGAAILSFLGGIRWGLAVGGGGADGTLPRRLATSVVPSLVAWLALLLSMRPCLLVLAAGIAAMLWADVRATRMGEAPPWYPGLRWPLSCVAVAALLFAALAA